MTKRKIKITKVNVTNFLSIAKHAFIAWRAKDPFRQSAVIAYFSIFSLPGLLILLIAIAGYFFGNEEVNAHLMEEINTTLGADSAEQVQFMITKSEDANISIWATMIGILTIIIGATGVFGELQKALNNIWEVKPRVNRSRFKRMLISRVFSFGLIISLSFILIASLVVSTLISVLGEWISHNFSESLLIVVQITNLIMTTAILSVMFAFMYKYLPDAKVLWRHVWIGAILTAILFELGKFLLELYFGRVDPGKGYGAGGAVILILLWVSYSSMIMYYGAEFTRAYVVLHSEKVEPTDVAVEANPEDFKAIGEPKAKKIEVKLKN